MAACFLTVTNHMHLNANHSTNEEPATDFSIALLAMCRLSPRVVSLIAVDITTPPPPAYLQLYLRDYDRRNLFSKISKQYLEIAALCK
jgi:hypothetical protein